MNVTVTHPGDRHTISPALAVADLATGLRAGHTFPIGPPAASAWPGADPRRSTVATVELAGTRLDQSEGASDVARVHLTVERRRLLGRVALLAADVSRMPTEGVAAPVDPALASTSAALVLAHLAATGPKRPRDVCSAIGMTSDEVSS